MPTKFKMASTGFGSAAKTFKRIADAGSKAHKKAMQGVTRAIFYRSQEYCPVDVGTLKASGSWFGEDGTDTYRGADQTSYVLYITYDDPKAIFVHECVNHFHAPPTSAKFISRAVDELWPELNNIAGEEYRNAFFVEYSGL